MKAILLAPLPPPMGGIAKWATLMQKAKLKNDWSIEVINEAVIGRGIFENENKKNVWIDIKRCFIIWNKLFKALKNKNAKVVHSNIPANTLSMLREFGCAVITRVYGKRFIVHFHCTIPTTIKGKIGFRLFKLICLVSGHVIVLNNASKEYVEKHTKAKAYLIPNFVEEDLIINVEKKISNKIKTALYVGGVIESKGCCTIIEIAKKFPEIEFRLVGIVSEKIDKMEKSDNVILTGLKTGENLEREFNNADVFLFLSFMEAEGFSVALTEAMAHGLPCIATNWAANKDMLEDKGGKIVPVKNVQAVADSLISMNEDISFREKASIWNVNRVKEAYSQHIVTDMIVDVYESI